MITYVQKSVEDYETAKFFEMNIMRDGEKLGYLELFVFYDEDGDETIAYVKSIELDEVNRNHGYGTAILKALAQEHDGIYLYPSNSDAERLYHKLGEEVDYSRIPDELTSEYDESGIMYYIS